MNSLVNALKMKLDINFYDRFFQVTGSPDFPYDLKEQIKKAIEPIIYNYFNKQDPRL